MSALAAWNDDAVRAPRRRFEGSDLAVENRPIDSLVPYVRNARTHSPAQVALIAGSIREFGFTNPVLVDGENGIIAGHGRVMAARQLGLATVPVIELAHLTEAKKRAYILADNRLAEQAGWDKELLALEVGDLAELGVDFSTLGFEAAEIDALLGAGDADPREEETPPLPSLPVSRPGDLWLCGRHRMLCGDATSQAAVQRLLGARSRWTRRTPPTSRCRCRSSASWSTRRRTSSRPRSRTRPAGPIMTPRNAVVPKQHGRPPHERDERIARQVEAMAGYGIPVSAIGKAVGLCQNTLRKHYRDELELGAVKANATVIESLFRKATGDGQGAVAAAIFWAKTRCGWRETNVLEHRIGPTQEQRDAAVAAALEAAR